MLTNKGILRTAAEQSAIDMGCTVDAFSREEHTILPAALHPGRRRYFAKTPFLHMDCYGHGVVAMADRAIAGDLEALFRGAPGFRCMAKLSELSALIAPHGRRLNAVSFYLPKPGRNREVRAPFDIEVLLYDDVHRLYRDTRFPMALGYFEGGERQDVIAAVARRDGEIMGVAGASNDSDTMWQVGIDVLPEHRGRGVATALVKRITAEILSRGIVPFYGTPWSHVASQKIAIGAGYAPGWAEIYTVDA